MQIPGGGEGDRRGAIDMGEFDLGFAEFAQKRNAIGLGSLMQSLDQFNSGDFGIIQAPGSGNRGFVRRQYQQAWWRPSAAGGTMSVMSTPDVWADQQRLLT